MCMKAEMGKQREADGREVQKMDMLQDVEREREFPTGRPKLGATCKGTGDLLYLQERLRSFMGSTNDCPFGHQLLVPL